MNDMNVKRKFRNPILPGFYPDPSLCRVGEYYYMVTSSFAYFPGVPIFHSKDLVSWEQIGHVLDRKSQLNLNGAGISGGIFAPTIRYNEGVFYMITTNVTNGGNFIVTAMDPAGDWSDPFWLDDAPGIDPSLFFDDDGKVYCTGNAPVKDAKTYGDMEIWGQELDLRKMKLIGERHSLWRGALYNAHCPEAPHIYKIDGYYYLMISEGGTQHYHAVTIARSKNIFGPYEGNPGNPILTHRHLGKKYPIANPGHADIVKTQNDEWWMVALASRPYGGYYKNLGRETFLVPMIWEDGWPIISPGTGKVELEYEVPYLPAFEVESACGCDDFDDEVLGYIWNGIHTPNEKFYSLNEKPGRLRLKLRPQSLLQVLKLPFMKDEKDNSAADDCPSFVGRRQRHMSFAASVKMSFSPMGENETAGLALVQNNNFQYRFEYTKKDKDSVVRLIKCISESKTNIETMSFKSRNIEEKLAEEKFESDEIYLKITASGQDYSFHFGRIECEMNVLAENVDGRILSPDIAGGFVGTYIGMFASSNGNLSDNFADLIGLNIKVNRKSKKENLR